MVRFLPPLYTRRSPRRGGVCAHDSSALWRDVGGPSNAPRRLVTGGLVGAHGAQISPMTDP